MNGASLRPTPELHCRYPRHCRLPAGDSLVFSRVSSSDLATLEAYLESVPEDEQRFVWHDLTVLADEWWGDTELPRLEMLLVRREEQVVADAILYREPGTWMSHIGKLRIFVHPAHRGLGIGSQVVTEMLEIGSLLHLRKVVAECTPDQSSLIGLLQRHGFGEAVRLSEFIQDRRGALHDLVLMMREIEPGPETSEPSRRSRA